MSDTNVSEWTVIRWLHAAGLSCHDEQDNQMSCFFASVGQMDIGVWRRSRENYAQVSIQVDSMAADRYIMEILQNSCVNMAFSVWNVNLLIQYWILNLAVKIQF